MGLADRLVFH